MTTLKFKKAINAELRNNDLRECVIDKVTTQGIQIVLTFQRGLHMKCIKWLNKRFAYGISLEEGSYNKVFINTPLEKRVRLD